MKKLILTILLLLQINSAHAMTYAKEPVNVFGLNWGSSIVQLQNNNQFTLLYKDKFITTYSASSLPKTLYNCTFDSVTYSFFNDKLFLITARQNSIDPYQNALYKTIVQNHSNPTAKRSSLIAKTTTNFWQGFNTTIELIEDIKQKETILKLYNHQLNFESQQQNK